MSSLKPGHKAVKTYYEALRRYSDQDVSHEGAVRSAFQNLLDETGRRHGWTLIPELGCESKNGTVYPDGTFRDDFYRPRGYWEAKDTRDHASFWSRRSESDSAARTSSLWRRRHPRSRRRNTLLCPLSPRANFAPTNGCFPIPSIQVT